MVTGGGENWNSPIKAVKGVLQRESEMLHITNDDDLIIIHMMMTATMMMKLPNDDSNDDGKM